MTDQVERTPHSCHQGNKPTPKWEIDFRVRVPIDEFNGCTTPDEIRANIMDEFGDGAILRLNVVDLGNKKPLHPMENFSAFIDHVGIREVNGVALIFKPNPSGSPDAAGGRWKPLSMDDLDGIYMAMMDHHASGALALHAKIQELEETVKGLRGAH